MSAAEAQKVKQLQAKARADVSRKVEKWKRDRAEVIEAPLWIRLVTWLFRLIVGAVFIFSGFVKAIDPWGTIYKVLDYQAAMGIHVLPTITTSFVFCLISIEFLIGVFLVLGCYRRGIPIAGLVFMAVMLPLTFWVMVKNPVPDCGCFGDAWVISNQATFWKNVGLTAMLAWLAVYMRRTHWIVRPSLQWLLFIASCAYVGIILEWGYNFQPFLDFRPYPVGSSLISESAGDASEPDYVFIYEKDGIKHEFSIDDQLPDEEDGWQFVERKEIRKDVKPGSKSFTVWSEDGEEDITADVLDTEAKQILLLMPALDEVSIASSYKINSLKEWAEKHGIDMIGVMSASPEEIYVWKDLSMPDYPIYTAEDTSIKELVRGNPAVVMTDQGRITLKTSLKTIDTDKLDEKDYGSLQEVMPSSDGMLRALTVIYLAIIAFLTAISAGVSLSLLKIFGKERRKKSDKPINKEPEKQPSEQR